VELWRRCGHRRIGQSVRASGDPEDNDPQSGDPEHQGDDNPK
jgi:hypothetical protein